MAKRSGKISKIVALAAAEERRHGMLTGRSQAELNKHVDRLNELHAMRHNYSRSSTGMDMIDSAHWKDYQNFMRRLDAAVHAQKYTVNDCEQTVEVHRQRWMKERQRLDSLERVCERYKDEERLQSDRDEQRKLDDLHCEPELYAEDDV